MEAKIVHDRRGEIRWLVVQDAEIDGELEIELEGEDESVTSVELGRAVGNAELRSVEAQRFASDVLKHYRVNVRGGRLTRREPAE